MKKISIIAVMVMIAVSCTGKEQPKKLESSIETVYQRADRLENEIMSVLEYTEEFHSRVYHCGARWTIGFGTTYNDKGERIQKSQAPIDRATAKKYLKRHLKNETLPFLSKKHKELNDAEFIALISYAYNAGSGYGARAFNNWLKSGKNEKIFIKNIFILTTSKGKLAEGLTKRRWLEGAIFSGKIKPSDLAKLPPAGYAKMDNADFHKTFFDKNKWVDYSAEKIALFKSQFAKDNLEKLIAKQNEQKLQKYKEALKKKSAQQIAKKKQDTKKQSVKKIAKSKPKTKKATNLAKK